MEHKILLDFKFNKKSRDIGYSLSIYDTIAPVGISCSQVTIVVLKVYI